MRLSNFRPATMEQLWSGVGLDRHQILGGWCAVFPSIDQSEAMHAPTCRRHKRLGAILGLALAAAISIGAEGAGAIEYKPMGAYDTPPQFLARAGTPESYDFTGVNWQSPAAVRLLNTDSLTHSRSSKEPSSAQRVSLQAKGQGAVSETALDSSGGRLDGLMSGIGQKQSGARLHDAGPGPNSQSFTRASKSDSEAARLRADRAISVPPALWLFGCALVGLAGVGRLRRSE